MMARQGDLSNAVSGSSLSQRNFRSEKPEEAEIEKFSKLAVQWWDPDGPMRMLHRYNPARMAYIHAQLTAILQHKTASLYPLAGLDIVDIGCGAGLVSEPLSRLGANVTGIDPGQELIAIAKHHGAEQKLSICYRQMDIFALSQEKRLFDAVISMEVIEHIADWPQFLAAAGQILRPGGVMILATINRTAKSFALAIVAAEYILGLVPRGSHGWRKLITPQELTQVLARENLKICDIRGFIYNPLLRSWRKSRDISVNYAITAQKAGG